MCDCSDIDDIIVIRKDGGYLITKVADKVFVGNDIIYAQVFLKNDERTIYNIVYQDGKEGPILAKRCAITGLTRDKEYNLTKGTPGSRIIYLSANPNGEAEVIRIQHKPRARLEETDFDLILASSLLRANHPWVIYHKESCQRITLKEKDFLRWGKKDLVRRCSLQANVDGRGSYLGEFSADDKIMIITKSGYFRTTGFDLSNHFEDNILYYKKYQAERCIRSFTGMLSNNSTILKIYS